MSTISAGNTTTTSLIVTGDTTGNLAFQTQGGTNTLTVPNVTGTVVVGSTSIGASGTRLISDGTNAVWVGNLYYVVSFTRDMTTASGTQSVTGIGFKPKAANFNSAVNGSNTISYGFDDGTTSESWISVIQGGLPTYYGESGNSIHYDPNGGDANTYRGKISSMDADGFTITWTKVGSPTGTIRVYGLIYR
jgi:hypothetical protein